MGAPVSKTDNTRPWRIRAADPDNQRRGIAYYFHSMWAHDLVGDCDERCGWTMPHRVLCSPPAWYVHEVWSGPERRRERDGLRAMAKEWNANYWIDDEDFPSYQHRHSAAAWWT